MRKTLALVAWLATLSYHNEQLVPSSCRVRYPLKELGWLKDYVSKLQARFGEITVYQAIYQGQTIFSVGVFYGSDAASGELYRCDGSLICRSSITIGGQQGDCGTISQEITNQVLIYERKR